MSSSRSDAVTKGFHSFVHPYVPFFSLVFLESGVRKVSGRCLEVHTLFLAAMSSSRSDGVTQFVCLFVCTLFFLLVSLEFVVHLETFKGVSRKFQGCFQDQSRMF